MTEHITQRELRNDSGRVMRALDEGRSFVVTRHGVPVGELVPLHRARFVAGRVALAAFRDAPPIDVLRLRGDLDTVADSEVRLDE